MSTLDLCEKFFGKRDIYELLEVAKDAATKDIKKAYYKLSLQVHPDRVPDEEKAQATEKFKVLSKIYQVLTDKDKRALYDEQGVVDEDDDLESKLTNWLDLWRKIFQPLTLDDISNYEKSYVGSELERKDIQKAYLSGKGCINHMMDEVPFLKVTDEPRLQQIVREMIDANEVPEYKAFTNENSAKRKRRHQKYERESKCAEKLKKTLNEKNKKMNDVEESSDLSNALLERRNARKQNFDSLMDNLVKKYGGEDDSDAIDLNDLGKRSTNKKKKKKPATKSKEPAAKANSELREVKNGKVKKRKN